jgi:O-antigen/teichoic acid export membrane protein
VVFTLSDAVLRALVVLAFIGLLDLGILGYTLGTLVAVSSGALAQYFIAYRGLRPGFDKKLARKITKYVLPLVPGILFVYVGNFGSRFFILSFLGLEQVAIYALAVKIASVAKIALQAFRQAWQPVAMQSIGEADREKVYRKTLDVYALAASFICLAFYAGADLAVKIFAPPEYGAAAELIPAVVAAFLVAGTYDIFGMGVYISKMTQHLSFATALGVVTNIAIILVFIENYGIPAVVAALLLGNVVNATTLYFMSNKLVDIPYRGISIITILALLPLFCLAALLASSMR